MLARCPGTKQTRFHRESGRIYSDMLTRHYRLYRKQGVWLTRENGERVEDALGGPTSLHAHNRDAAKPGFYKACKTAKACKQAGLDTKYPYHRKRWRTTIWKSPKGMAVQQGVLLLKRAKGLTPLPVSLPSQLVSLPATAFLEARLVWDRAARHYSWHLVVEDDTKPAPPPPGDHIAAVDLGEIHPAALTDGQETVIITCRALRANQQYSAKRLAEIQAKQARKHKGSRSWKRVLRRKVRFLARQKRRARDMEHKISRAVVNWAKERQISTLVIGDVRDVADGKRLNTKSQQKVGLWSHGRQRTYITYKAEAAGMTVTLCPEAYTSQTCPGSLPDGTACMQCHKPKGRRYVCPACGFTAHRDAVGCANILSQHYTGEPGHVLPPKEKYRHPVQLGKRSRLDTAEMASEPTTQQG